MSRAGWDGNVFHGVDWNARRGAARPPAPAGPTAWDPMRPSPLMGFDNTKWFAGPRPGAEFALTPEGDFIIREVDQ